MAAASNYLRNHPTFPGVPQENAANVVSAGVADANKIVALNSNGVLDSTIVNSIIVSPGASASGKIPALNAAGMLDSSVMPPGVAADTAIINASETIANNAYVNIWNNAGAFAIRNASAATAGKFAHGFVLTGGASGTSLTVYFVGPNVGLSGQTPGDVYLSASTPGVGTGTAPTGTGVVQQKLGVAVSATVVNFTLEPPLVLA